MFHYNSASVPANTLRPHFQQAVYTLHHYRTKPLHDAYKAKWYKGYMYRTTMQSLIDCFRYGWP